MNKTYFVLLIFLGIISLNGCLFNGSQKQQEPQTICSEDSLLFITIPKGWVQITDHELNDDAELQAKKLLGNQYVVVLTEYKEDLDYTFDEWRTLVLESYLSSFDNVTVSDTVDITIDGQPAKQYEINGSMNRVKISMLATYVDGKMYYAQILTWTISSKYKSAVENFKKITNSIKGLN